MRKGVAPLVAAKTSGGLCLGISADGFSRNPAHTDVIGSMSARLSVCKQDSPHVRVAISRKRTAPRLYSVDGLDTAGET